MPKRPESVSYHPLIGSIPRELRWAWRCFKKETKDRQYGPKAFIIAWEWFKTGWMACMENP